MTDYASLKVPELKKLLQEKSLSVQGNKADLITRLKENDAKVVDVEPAAVPAADEDEDEIDYSDDEVKVKTSRPAVASSSAAAAVPDTASATAAETEPETSTADQGVVAAEDAVPEAVKESFALNLSATDVEIEARKRADRAKRFDIPDETDEEAKKRTDRAARFGVDASSVQVAGLDDALPERRPKRGRAQDKDKGKDDAADAGARPSKRQSTDGTRERRQPGRGGRNQQSSSSSIRGGGGGRQGRGNSGSNNNSGRKTGVLDDPSERAKAEDRKKRFKASA